ncbi:MAG: hypothetical protein SOY42_07300 [Clostridium sp.]|nr:hypothetical protein [Clostridium sp.]
MKKIINIIGFILLSLNIIYLINIILFDWEINGNFEKSIVLLTIFLNALYVLYRMFLDKKKC